MRSYCRGAYTALTVYMCSKLNWKLHILTSVLCFKHIIFPFLVYCALYTMRFCHSIFDVFQAISTWGFWKEHNTLLNSKWLAKIDNFDTILYMYVSVLLVFDRILYRPGEGRMRPNVVSTKLISPKWHQLDVIENHWMMLLAVSLTTGD